MAKFVVVDSIPENLTKEDYTVVLPTFVAEITASKNKAPASNTRKLTTINHLREIVACIAQRYDKELNPLSAFPYSSYEGVQYQDEADLSDKVLLRMFRKHYPQIFGRYIDRQLKIRPKTVKTVYFVCPKDQAENSLLQVFIDNGLDAINPQELKTKKNKFQSDDSVV